MERAACLEPFAPLHDAADGGSEQHTQILWGDVVEVAGRSGAWAQVTVPDGYRGFTRTSALGPLPGTARHVVVEPRAGGRYLGSWLPEGGPGTEPLAEARGAACGAALLATARLLVGAPYEWGGVTADGIDCSGLVQTCMRRFGVLVPRDADQQEAVGAAVGPGEERAPGDLLLFGDHVALVAGPREVVHASGPAGRVLEEPLPAARADRIRAVRRPFPAPVAVR